MVTLPTALTALTALTLIFTATVASHQDLGLPPWHTWRGPCQVAHPWASPGLLRLSLATAQLQWAAHWRTVPIQLRPHMRWGWGWRAGTGLRRWAEGRPTGTRGLSVPSWNRTSSTALEATATANTSSPHSPTLWPTARQRWQCERERQEEIKREEQDACGVVTRVISEWRYSTSSWDVQTCRSSRVFVCRSRGSLVYCVRVVLVSQTKFTTKSL